MGFYSDLCDSFDGFRVGGELSFHRSQKEKRAVGLKDLQGLLVHYTPVAQALVSLLYALLFASVLDARGWLPAQWGVKPLFVLVVVVVFVAAASHGFFELVYKRCRRLTAVLFTVVQALLLACVLTFPPAALFSGQFAFASATVFAAMAVTAFFFKRVGAVE